MLHIFKHSQNGEVETYILKKSYHTIKTRISLSVSKFSDGRLSQHAKHNLKILQIE